MPLAGLVDAARAGCPGAWRAVVERYDDGLHAIARGYGLDAATVDDAVQATWLSAVTHLAALREPAALSGWLRSILHRECLKAANRASREIPVVEQHLGGPRLGRPRRAARAAPRPPEDEAIRRADLAALREAVRRRLSEREQRLMTLLSDERGALLHRHRPRSRRPDRQHRPHPGSLHREAAPAAGRVSSGRRLRTGGTERYGRQDLCRISRRS